MTAPRFELTSQRQKVSGLTTEPPPGRTPWVVSGLKCQCRYISLLAFVRIPWEYILVAIYRTWYTRSHSDPTCLAGLDILRYIGTTMVLLFDWIFKTFFCIGILPISPQTRNPRFSKMRGCDRPPLLLAGPQAAALRARSRKKSRLATFSWSAEQYSCRALELRLRPP